MGTNDGTVKGFKLGLVLGNEEMVGNDEANVVGTDEGCRDGSILSIMVGKVDDVG